MAQDAKGSNPAQDAKGSNPGTPTAAAEQPKKAFYLACSFCRWTSRDAGIPDQSVASGAWPERENSNIPVLKSIFEHFRGLAVVEKAERERKRFATKRRGYMPWAVIPWNNNILQ